MPRDIVCGRPVQQEQSLDDELYSMYAGVMYYFCSHQCKHRFDHDPVPYLHDPADYPEVPFGLEELAFEQPRRRAAM